MLPGRNTLQCVYQSVKYNADNFTTKTNVKKKVCIKYLCFTFYNCTNF